MARLSGTSVESKGFELFDKVLTGMVMKSENSIYHVLPTTPGQWKVIGDGAAPSYHTTEAEAVSTAREWAMINEPSHIVIHKADGSIEEEYMMQMDSVPHAPLASSETGDRSAPRGDDFKSRLRDRNRRNGPRGRQDGYSHRNGASL
jgi:hypothetical protein